MKIRSRFREQVKIVSVEFVPGADPADFFAQVVAARADIPEGEKCKFLVKRAGAGKPQLASTPESLATAIEATTETKPLVVVIRCPGLKKNADKGYLTRVRVRSIVGTTPQVVRTKLDVRNTDLADFVESCSSLLPAASTTETPVLHVRESNTKKMIAVETTEMLHSLAQNADQKPVCFRYSARGATKVKRSTEVGENKEYGDHSGQLQIRTILGRQPQDFYLERSFIQSNFDRFLDAVWRKRGLSRGSQGTFLKPWSDGKPIPLLNQDELLNAVEQTPAKKPLRLILRPIESSDDRMEE